MALNGLMHSDPARALPMLEKFLAAGRPRRKLRDRALFVLSPERLARRRATIVIRRGPRAAQPRPAAQAIKYLGLFGGEREPRRRWRDIYAAGDDIDVKKAVLHGFMVSGDEGPRAGRWPAARRTRAAARRPSSSSGSWAPRPSCGSCTGARPTTEVKKAILHAMFIGGGAERLIEAAAHGEGPGAAADAIHSLGLVGGARRRRCWPRCTRPRRTSETRRQVLKALFLQGNAPPLVADGPHARRTPSCARRRCTAVPHAQQGSHRLPAWRS